MSQLGQNRKWLGLAGAARPFYSRELTSLGDSLGPFRAKIGSRSRLTDCTTVPQLGRFG
jgi:hypothetical protein